MLQYLHLLNYACLVMGMHNSLAQTAHCAKDHYTSYWDKKQGPLVNGKKATYHYYNIPWSKIVKAGVFDKQKHHIYKIYHPDFADECKEVVLAYKDENDVVRNAQEGVKYNIAVAMMYLNGVATKVFVVPVKYSAD